MSPAVAFVLIALGVILIIVAILLFIEGHKKQKRNRLLKKGDRTTPSYVAVQRDRCARLLSKPNKESLEYAKEYGLSFLYKEAANILKTTQEDWNLLQTVLFYQEGICTETQMGGLLKFSSFLSIVPEKIILRGNVPVPMVDKREVIVPTATVFPGSSGLGFGVSATRTTEYDFKVTRDEEIREQFPGRYVADVKSPVLWAILCCPYRTFDELYEPQGRQAAEKLFSLIEEVSKKEELQFYFRDEKEDKEADIIYAEVEKELPEGEPLFENPFVGAALTDVYLCFYKSKLNQKLDKIYPERKKERY